MKTITFLILSIVLFSSFTYAQIYENWVIKYNGTGNALDEATALAVDQSQNVYVTGFSVNSNSDMDYVTIKYDACGNPIWNRIFNYGNDYAHDMKIDGSGNIIVSGTIYSQFNTQSLGTIKYNSSGNFQWQAFHAGSDPLINSALKIFVDGTGNSYVTGVTSQIGASLLFDVITVKYNSAGVYQWQQIYDYSGGDDQPEAIVSDSQGNIYIVGGSYGNSTDFDFFLLKYSPGGGFIGHVRYNGEANGSDGAYSVAVDDQNNVYVTGISMEYEIPQSESSGQNTFTTLKYNSSLQLQWVKKYFGTGTSRYAKGNSIKVLNSNEIYVTGNAHENGNYDDFVTLKYNGSGNLLWVAKYNGSGNRDDNQNILDIDQYGNSYVTGASKSGIVNDTRDYATIKYNSSGVQQWVKRYNGSANKEDIPSAITVTGTDVAFVTGKSTSSNFDFDYATARYSNQWLTCFVEESMNNNLNDVFIVNKDTAFAVGNNGRLITSHDKGIHWSVLNSGVNNNLNKVKFFNKNIGIILSDSLLLKTTNGGITWSRLGIPQLHLKDVYILNNRLSFISCTNGRILKSNDFWNSWNIQNTNLSENISKVFYSDSLKGKCISENGKIIKTTNGGITWTNLSSLNFDKVNNAFFKTSNLIIAIGDNGKIMFTSNGGVNWINRNLSQNIRLNSSYIDNDSNLYISGDNGLILFSSNYGAKWEEQPTFLSSKIQDMEFFDSNSGVAVTDEGQILLTSLGTIETGNIHEQFRSSEIVNDNSQKNSDFSLYQNYPNPFNPKTQIKFEITENTFVVLKVYNVLGKEVRTLVNENLGKGIHSISFDGSDLTSGIYFYKIFAGDYVNQKQMLLIK